MTTTRRSGPPEGGSRSAESRLPNDSDQPTHTSPPFNRARTAWEQDDHEAEVAGIAQRLGDELRRRWEASLRLPPLADGRRDPFDPRPRDGRWR